MYFTLYCIAGNFCGTKLLIVKKKDFAEKTFVNYMLVLLRMPHPQILQKKHSQTAKNLRFSHKTFPLYSSSTKKTLLVLFGINKRIWVSQVAQIVTVMTFAVRIMLGGSAQDYSCSGCICARSKVK